jgi:hypothetical protein
VENFCFSRTVKVRSSTTSRPERVSALCLRPSFGWVLVYPSMYSKK